MQLIACESNSTPCPLEDQILVSSELTNLLMNGGFDVETFEFVFIRVLLLWVTGLAIGYVIAMIRKTRTP